MMNRKNPFDLLLVWLGTVGLAKEDADNLMKGKDLSLDARGLPRLSGEEGRPRPAMSYEIKTLADGAVVAAVENSHGVRTTEHVPSYSGGDREVQATHRVYNETSLRTHIEGLKETGMDTAPEEAVLAALEIATAEAGQTEAMQKTRIVGFVAEGTIHARKMNSDYSDYRQNASATGGLKP